MRPDKQRLVHITETTLDEPRLWVTEYGEADHRVREVKPEELAGLTTGDGVVWVNVDGRQDEKTVAALGERFGLHPLLLEDVTNMEQRPKLEEYVGLVFVVMKMLRTDPDAERIYVEHMSLILKDKLVITFQERVGDVFDDVRKSLKNATGKIRKLGADYLAYRLVDAIVDNYFVAVDAMAELVETMETQMTEDPKGIEANELHMLKRESLFLRKVVVPAREIIATFSKLEDTALIQPVTHVYLRDVYDHTAQVAENLDVQRGILASMTDVYHASLSNRLNEVMKVMTMVSTIFIPLSFIAGVYGMNFRYMPELHERWGYPVVLAVMIVAAIGMLALFKRKRWF